MSGWQAGDLALCIKQGPWRRRASGRLTWDTQVRSGMILTVRKVAQGKFGRTVLWFEGVGCDLMGDCYAARRFIKVTPPSEQIKEHRAQEVEA